jgi:hypothetical protein
MKRLLRPWLSLLLMPLLMHASALAQTCSNADPTTAGIVPGDPIDGNTPPVTATNVKIDPPNAGTYALGTGSVTIAFSEGPCGEVMTWTSTGNIVIDYVYAKGSNSYLTYNYTSTGRTSDGNVHCPLTPSGKYSDFSHVNFVFHYVLDVSKTANTTFTRTYNWTIDKSVSPAKWDLFKGDKGTSTYTVDVKGNGYTDRDWAVSGTIKVENNTPLDATITGISDVLSGGVTGSVNCSVTFPYVLKKGDKLECSYTASLPSGTDGTNVATVTTSSTNVQGGSGTADYRFVAPTTEVNKTVAIRDDKYEPSKDWSATWRKDETFSFHYTKDFSCTDKGKFENIASIVETSQSDDATVTVNCYDLEVTKTAATSLTRTWDWTINKSADPTALTLSAGQTHVVNYTVTVNAPKYTDSKWKVSGNISVKNPAPVGAMINNLSDIVSSDIAASVNCSVTFPYKLEAGATLNCTYTADLPDANARTNTATATIQNYNTAADGTKSESGTTNYSGTANVDFSSAAITKVDECADVTDKFMDNAAVVLGTVCAADAPKTFAYSYTVGPFTTSGIYPVRNVATLTTGSGNTQTGSSTVTVTVPQTGCTLTQGYWKTHSKSGPAPYDDAWKNLPGTPVSLEENTLFFKSGRTWIAVFRTPPAGNAFFNLAHQYMAAKLNVLNGAATTTAVASAITDAETLFNSLANGSVTLTNTQTRTARSLASTLDQYNNGLIGPGHCDEDGTSSNSTTSASAAAPAADVVEQQQAIPQAGIGLKAWPNPTATGFTIRYGTENLQAPVKVRVFDLNGKLIYATTGQANRNLSFGEGFAKGIYLVEVTQENQRQTMRLIKQ